MAERKSLIFYGWIIVAVTFVTLLTIYGLRHSFSVFYVAILDEFGWSRADTSLIFSINVLVYGISAPIAGGLVDRFGPRVILPMGALITALGALGCSLSNQVWHFYFIYGVIMAFGMSTAGFAPHAPVLSNWFVRKRGAAMGIAMAGIGVSFVVATVAQYLISYFGWRAAFLILGSVIAVVVVPITAMLQRHRPQDKGLLPDSDTEIGGNLGGHGAHGTSGEDLMVDHKWATTEWNLAKALLMPRFWFLFFAFFFFWGVGIYLVLQHFIAFASDMGYSRIFAAWLVTFYGVTNSLGHAMGGYISDRMGRELTYTLSVAGAIVAILMLFLTRDASQPWMLVTYSTLLGLSAGVCAPTGTAISADLFQGKNFGSINGFIVMGFGMGGSFGPWLGGYIYDLMGNYNLAFIICILALGLAGSFIWVVAPRKVRLVGGKARAAAVVPQLTE